MFIAALFTIAKTWNQPKCPSIIVWIKEMQYMHAMEYYVAIIMNEVLSFAETWMELKGIFLNKSTQEQKTKPHMFSLISGSRTVRTHEHMVGTTHSGARWGDCRAGRAPGAPAKGLRSLIPR